MGRRSINTTKSGKYMNPTDQARKEARKKELKKNKKQRQMVRQAVLKNKDPGQLLEEMEKIDEMEYNVLQPSPLNEKVLKEKRKKLKETFDRVMRLLHEDDPETFSEMKRKEVDYEKRKYKRVQYFESVRHAEQVSIEDIPLPSSTNEKTLPSTIPKINLPPPVLLTNLPPIIPIKKPDEISETQDNKEKEPPGVPPQFPPNIFEMRELDSDYESSEESEKEGDEIVSKDEPSKDKHDKNIEEFMKEVESVQKKKEDEKILDIRIDPTPDVDMGNEEAIEDEQPEIPQILPEKVEIPKIPEQPIVLPPQPMPPMALPRMPHPLMFRPPPLRGHLGMGIRMPPGPPPGPRPGMPRMAPGPPPRHKHHDRNQMMPPKQTTTTITAKPQIRNLSADVTRFVPSTLRSKRDEPRKTKPKSYIETQMQQVTMHKQQQQTQTKDDAYHQFMNELQDLL